MMDRRNRLDDETYLATLEREGETLAAAAQRDPTAAVSGCPGWSVADLVWHTGRVHAFWGAIVGGGLQSPEGVERPTRPPDEDLFEWYRSNLAQTVGTLRGADPSTPVWSWTDEKTVAWIRRRTAHETAVHRWDAASATGDPSPIERSLAVDGVDEFLEFFVTKTKDAPDLSVHLHATDADGEWLASVTNGRLSVSREHRKGDVAIRGSASDLLLLLWSRIPEADVEVHGDRATLFRFLELADTD